MTTFVRVVVETKSQTDEVTSPEIKELCSGRAQICTWEHLAPFLSSAAELSCSRNRAAAWEGCV